MSAYYLYTGQTTAQTQIDTDHTTSWLLTANSAWTLGGGHFVMKRGSATTGDISLVVRTGSATGSEVARVTLSAASFGQSFTETAFNFAQDLALQANTSYYIGIESSAPDVQSQAYFIKGVQDSGFEDLSQNVLSNSAYALTLGGSVVPVAVTDVTVSEASPYAVFTVTGTINANVVLTTASGTATQGTDFGSGLEYYDGSAWVSYTAGSNVSLGAGGSLLVRSAITNDAGYEGPETFTLTATPTTGTAGTGTGTITDDASSTNVFLSGNTTATPTAGTADDDRTAPSQVVSILSISTDSGTAGDFITNTAAQTVSATLDAVLKHGEALYGSLDNGATWADITSSIKGTAVSWASVTLNGGVHGSNTLHFVIKDQAGNTGKAATQAYTLDRATPSQSVYIDSLSLDSGTAGDFITNTASQTVAGHLSAKLGSGDLLEGSLDNGTTWLDITTHVTNTTVSWTGTKLNGGVDGSNTLRLRVNDTAGNIGATAQQAYTLDTTAPSQAISIASISTDTGTAGDFITNTAAQTVSATLGAVLQSGEALYGSLDNGTTWADITSSIKGTAVSWAGVTLNGGVDGSNTMRLRIMDRAGNTGTTASQAYTLDRVAPTQKASVTSLSADTGTAGDFITRTAAQTITGTLSAPLGTGDVLQGSLDNGVTWADITDMVSGTAISWSGTTLNAGTGAIRLRLADQAGNAANSTSRAYTLDITPPPVPSDIDIATATDTAANDRTTAHNLPIIGFTSEAGLVISLAGPAGGVLTPGGSGNYQVAATGARYTVTMLDAKPSQAGKQPFGSYAGGAATGNAADLADGLYTLTGTDLAGNQSTLGSFIIDTTPPTAPSNLDISAATDTGTNDLRTWNGRPVLTFTAESGLGVVLKGASSSTLLQGLNGNYSLSEVAQSGSLSVYTVTLLDADLGRTGSQPYGTYATGALTKNAANTSDGTYTLVGTDTAGNSTTLGSFVITTPLAPRITQLPKNSATIGTSQRLAGLSCDDITRTPVVSGTAEANTTLRLFDMVGLPSGATTTLATVTADSAGRWSASLPSLAQGVHHVVAQQVDANGTVGGYGFYDFIYDTRAPVVTEVLTRNAAGRISQIAGTGEAGLRVALSNGTTSIGSATVGMNGKWSFLPPASVANAAGVIAAQTDYAGNIGVAVTGNGMTYSAPTNSSVAVRSTGTGTVVQLDATIVDMTLDFGTDKNWRLEMAGLTGTFASAAAIRNALVAEGSSSMLSLPLGGAIHFFNLAPTSTLFDSTHLRLT